jgi:putative DNA primase/helicase
MTLDPAQSAPASDVPGFRDLIQSLIDVGYHLLRIDIKEKTPVDKGWPTRATTDPQAFLKADGTLAYNVGIATGSVSGGLVCVDLDGIAPAIATQFLPPTGMCDGRKGSPCSHWWYRITDTAFGDDILPGAGTQIREAMDRGTVARFAGSRRFRSARVSVINGKAKKIGIDLQMAGAQVVVPPSLHPSGELREWHGGVRGDPASITLADLISAVERLGVHIGWVRKSTRAQAATSAGAKPAKTKPTKPKEAKTTQTEGTGAGSPEAASSEPNPGPEAQPEGSDPFPAAPASEANVLAARRDLEEHGPAISDQGGHHHTFVACCLVGDRGLNREQAEREILAWNKTCVPPWDEADLQRQLANSYRGRQTPVGSQAVDDGVDPADDLLGTDIYLADRFIADHHEILRFCIEFKLWLVWDGIRWTTDKGGILVQELAKVTARRLRQEAATSTDRNRQADLWASAGRATSKNGIAAMVDLAHSDKRVVISADKLDDPEKCRYLLNTPNGLVDLRTGELRPHDKDLLITKVTGAEYHPEAQHPAVGMVLATLAGDDPEIRECLERTFGMSATGDTSAKVLVALIGKPDCGKGTSLEAHRSALGGYAQLAPVELFVDNDTTGRATPEIAALKGVRMAYCNETEEGAKLDADKLKRIVGGDEVINGRFLYQDNVEFPMEALLLLASNDKPWVNDADDAMWRRMLVFEPTASVPAELRDPSIKSALKRDPVARSAWLAMVVRGAGRWYADGGGYRGLKVPKSLDAIRARYRADIDPLADFIEERMELGPDRRITRSDMHSLYVGWCKQHGAKPMSAKAFTKRVRAISGISEGYVLKVQGWLGVGQRAWT